MFAHDTGVFVAKVRTPRKSVAKLAAHVDDG
jgi:hypothetical protein